VKNKFLPFILFLISSVPMYGQKNDSLRSIYVERFPNYFFVWPVLKQRTTSFEIEQIGNRGNRIEFKPNNAYGAGFGVYLFELLAEVTFSVPVDEKKNELFGKSRATDVQLNILGRNWGADLFYQRYTGFYINDPNAKIAVNAPYPQRPDMSTDNFGVNGIYIFNKNKFSLRSAYNFAERQRKSAGSFLLAGTISSFQLKADSAIYGKSYETMFGTKAAVSEFDAFTFSVAPGYAYTVVIKNFFINASFSAGPAFRSIDYKVNDVRYSSNGIDAFTDFRIAVGYNANRFFSGISYVGQSRNAKIDEVKLTAVSATTKLVIGYRFKEFGILKARAFDLVPFGKEK
jgi:Domain of unknown function (DUF4421)